MKITLSKYKSRIFLLVLYVFTYGVWIELFGINNVYRYLIYLIVIASILGGILISLKSKEESIFTFITFANWIYFFIYFFINHYGGIVEVYNYYFISMAVFSMIDVFSSKLGDVRQDAIHDFFKLSGILGLLDASATFYEAITHHYILQSGSFNYLSFSSTNVTRANGLIGSTLINGMLLGFLTITFLFLYYKNCCNRKYIVFLIFSFVALLFTMSRGPLVSTIVGCLLFLSLKEGNANKRLLRLILAFISVVVFFEVITSIQTDNAIILRLQSILNWTSEAGNVTRIYVWKSVLEMMKGNELFGMGIGSLDYYNIPVTESGWIYILFETGVVGLLVYLFPIIHTYKVAFSVLKRNRSTIVAYCISVLTAILIENTVLQVLTSLIVQIVFGSMIAIIYIVASCKEDL